MSENPYSSPSDAVYEAVGPDDVFVGERPRRRPLGISILAVLHILVGAGQFGAIASLGALGLHRASLGMPGLFLLMTVVSIVVLGSVWLGSGVGMWSGAKWGWWTGAFCHASGVLRKGATVVIFLLTSGPQGPMGFLLVGTAFSLLIQALLMLYFFKANVLEFFGLEGVAKLKAVGFLFGVSLAILAAFTLVPQILSYGRLM